MHPNDFNPPVENADNNHIDNPNGANHPNNNDFNQNNQGTETDFPNPNEVNDLDLNNYEDPNHTSVNFDDLVFIPDTNETPEIESTQNLHESPSDDDHFNTQHQGDSTSTYSHIPNPKREPLIIRLSNPPPNENQETQPKPEESTQNQNADNNATDEIADEDKWKCPICLEGLQQPVVTRCGHVFCWPCIHEWLRRSQTCPVCHGQLEERHLIPIYGQGDDADLSSPPPPKPEYRNVGRNQVFNLAFVQLILQDFQTRYHNFFYNNPSLYVQLFAIIFFIISFYV